MKKRFFAPRCFTRLLLSIGIGLLLSLPLAAQEPDLPNHAVMGGLAYNQYSEAPIQTWASYAKRLTGPLYSFSSYDITATDYWDAEGKLKFPTLQYAARSGVAVHIRDFGRMSAFLLGDAGIAASSQSAGLSYSGGGFASYRLKDGWGIVGAMRITRDPAGGTRYVPEIGIAYGVK
jgi:hypothetical protein